MLDLCCNTGGFAVYAKGLGGADEVVGVDLDEQVIALAKHNANLNQARVRFVQADLFSWLRRRSRSANAMTSLSWTHPSRRATAKMYPSRSRNIWT